MFGMFVIHLDTTAASSGSLGPVLPSSARSKREQSLRQLLQTSQRISIEEVLEALVE